MKKILMVFALLLIITGCGKEEKDLGKENSTKSTISQKESVEEKDGHISFTDLAGQEIRLEKPAEKIILQGSGSGGAFMTMMALDKDNFLAKIRAIDPSLENNREDLYKKLLEAYPDLEKIDRVPEFKKNDFSLENLISLEADLMILPISYKQTMDMIKDKLGTPIVYVDYHSQNLSKHIQSTEIIAKATGLDKNLDEIIDFYKTRVEKVIDAGKELKDKKTAYIEVGSDGPDVYANSYGSDMMWGKIIGDCGAINISAEVLDAKEANPISPEFLFKKDPDYIILTGSNWASVSDSLHMGFDSTEESVKSDLDRFLKRKGWDKLKAVKNKNIYAIAHTNARDMTDFYAYESLGKVFDPEKLKDMDPEKDIKEFYEKFMPIKFEGVHFYKYE